MSQILIIQKNDTSIKTYKSSIDVYFEKLNVLRYLSKDYLVILDNFYDENLSFQDVCNEKINNIRPFYDFYNLNAKIVILTNYDEQDVVFYINENLKEERNKQTLENYYAYYVDYKKVITLETYNSPVTNIQLSDSEKSIFACCQLLPKTGMAYDTLSKVLDKIVIDKCISIEVLHLKGDKVCNPGKLQFELYDFEDECISFLEDLEDLCTNESDKETLKQIALATQCGIDKLKIFLLKESQSFMKR